MTDLTTKHVSASNSIILFGSNRHSHPDTDETFIIIEGTLVMNFRHKVEEINAGEMIVIPKGVEHKPFSENGYKAILIEPEGVPNTGNVQSEVTIEKIEWV